MCVVQGPYQMYLRHARRKGHSTHLYKDLNLSKQTTFVAFGALRVKFEIDSFN